MTLTAIAILLLTLFNGGLLLGRRDRLRGTTLTHAWAWCLASLLAIAALEWILATRTNGGDSDWTSAFGLIAATSTFCPAMAVLGAQRPLHRMWQFVVLTLWIMLALPALEAIFLNRLAEMDVGPVRAWFLWLMVAVNLLIYLPTRYMLSALLVTAGQIILLGTFLPGLNSLPSEIVSPCALLFFTLAIAACRFAPARKTTNDFDKQWLHFRDHFGTMWALRIIERINATGQINNWPLSLTWTGFYFHNADDDWKRLSPKVQQELQQAMDNLLRRFV